MVIDPVLFVLLGLLLLSAFFSGSEIALFTLSNAKVRRVVREKKKGSAALERLRKRPHRLMSTILIGNNVVNITASSIATVLATTYFGALGAGIAVGIMTFLILVFSELIPKSFAVVHKEKLALFVAPIVETTEVLLTPIVWFLEKLSETVLSLFGGQTGMEGKLSEEDIRAVVVSGAEEGAILPEEKKMIENIFQFNDTTVKEVMTPRTRMFMLEAKTPLSKVRKQLIKLPFSRIPVYDKDEDNIVGIMHMKTALTELMKKSTKKTASYKMMPVIFVPETRKINTLFHEFQEKHIHIAIVVGEHGGAKGLVTLEDLLEEIVGEIVDETDISRVMIRRLNKNTWVADGDVELEEINKKLGLSLHHDNFTTLAGWILSQLDRMPKEKEKIKYQKITFIITKCNKTSVQEVKIIK